MLINLRNALMSGKRLPYDAELEYLLFDGTTSRRQYIETGIKVADPASVKIEVNSDAILPLGFTHNNLTTGTWVGVYNSTAVRVYYKDYPTGQSITPPSNIDAYIYDGGSGFYINGSQYASFVASVGTDSITDKSWRFGEVYDFKNADGKTDSAFNRSGKLYCLKIYVSGTLVRDYIPVRRGTVGYMYDRVSGKLFGNTGTGDFVLGPDVVPVEYIESHGTEWIDTGLLGRDGYDFEYRFRPLNPLPCGIGGEYQAFNNCYIGLIRSNGNLAYHYFRPNTIVEVQSLTLGADYDVKAHLHSDGQYFEVDGVRGGIESRTGHFTSSYNLYLFAINSDNQPTSFGVMRLYNLTAHLNTIPVRSFRSVRVGTGSTWEGAMMDVLTRRIYRNQGTGAFGYGNDLKYPIPAA